MNKAWTAVSSKTNTSELERAVAAGDVKVPDGTNPTDEKQMLLAVANRPVDSNTTYSTGGDVSRFQRRTVPARPMTAPQFAAGGAPAGPAGGTFVVSSGVRVARGNSVTVVPVGAR